MLYATAGKLNTLLHKDRPTWCHLVYYFIILCSTCFGCYYIHPQELATYLLSYFMGCIALVRCVLVLRCGYKTKPGNNFLRLFYWTLNNVSS